MARWLDRRAGTRPRRHRQPAVAGFSYRDAMEIVRPEVSRRLARATCATVAQVGGGQPDGAEAISATVAQLDSHGAVRVQPAPDPTTDLVPPPSSAVGSLHVPAGDPGGAHSPGDCTPDPACQPIPPHRKDRDHE